jgi:hypothetical protein
MIQNLGKYLVKKLIPDNVKTFSFFLSLSIPSDFAHPLRIFRMGRNLTLQCDKHIFLFYACPSNDNLHHAHKYNLSSNKI